MKSLILKSSDIKDMNIDVEESQEHQIIIVDIDPENVNANININIDNNAKLDLRIASYSANNEKQYNIKVNNNGFNSFSNVDCYGIANDNSKIVFNASTFVPKGAHNSEVKQKLKTLNIGDNVDISVNPILLIDELDCFASHAATNSKINDEELFYLETRAIDQIKAKEMITVANLTSVLYGESDNLIEEITNKILKVYND